MKKSVKSSVAVILAVILIVLSVPVSASGYTTPELYGRSALLELSRGSVYVQAYDRVYNAVENREAKVILSDLSLTLKEFTDIMTAYMGDPTGHFWISVNYSYSYDQNADKVYFVLPKYNGLTDKSYETVFENAAKGLISSLGIYPSMSDYQKAKLIHDALALRTDYVLSSANGHSAYGALVEGKAVCEGYTYAYSYLLSLVGIQSHGVYGVSNGEHHVWNLVRINDEFCYTDLTWDDQTEGVGSAKKRDIFYAYFNVTEAEMKKDHSFNSVMYRLPATVSKYGYFEMNPKRVWTSIPNVDTVASLFENEAFVIKSSNLTPNDIGNWFGQNGAELFQKLGYDLSKGVSLSMKQEKNEMHIYVDGTLIAPDVILGDIDKSGDVNLKDANILARIICGIYIPNTYETEAADINLDGDINAKDSNLIRRIVSGQ